MTVGHQSGHLLMGLDPDRDQARQWLEGELSKPDYNRAEPLVRQLLDWLLGRLDQLFALLPGSTSLGWVLLALVVATLLVVALFAVRGRRRHGILAQRAPGAVLEDPSLNAADYRRRAGQAAAAGDWEAVLLDSYRALTAEAAERTLIDDAPALTAHEVQLHLGAFFPAHLDSLRAAARAFDLVRYGDGVATPEAAGQVRDLDVLLSRSRPLAAAAAGGPR